LGLVLLASIGVGTWCLLTLPQRSAWMGDTLEASAAFADVNGLQVGTRVHLQGVDVGEVTAIALPDVGGGPVRVQLRLAGHLRSRLGTDTQVKIARDNPVGDRIVRLLPGQPDSPRLTDGVTLAAVETPDLFDGLAQTNRQLQTTLGKLDAVVAQAEAGKGSLGKLLKDDTLYNELASAARELKSAAYDVRNGEGTVGQLVKDRAAYEQALQTVSDVRTMVASVKQNSDAIKSLPVVRSYVVDANKILVRPDQKRLRKVFAEDELFEPGRAVLTEKGRERLAGVADWLKAYKTGEVVVAGIAADRHEGAFATTLTQKQSEAVREQLVRYGANRIGYWWWNTRPVRAIGCGNQPPSQPETESLPASRVEVILFMPES
jgi:phospholipid/cholesterol/gamma-HCH transport system substrate-binding protein